MKKNIYDVLNKLNKHGYEAFLVGGSCRDSLLNISFKDIDIATNASSSIISQLFNVIDDKGAQFGSQKILYRNQIMELTSFRKEHYKSKSIYPIIDEFAVTPREDSARRDFTINALYMTKDEKILDFYQGLDDLRKKQIVFIGNSVKRIMEDPSRILRALRLSLKIGFSIEDVSSKAIKENIEELKRLSSKKIKYEVKKTILESSFSKTKQMYEKYNITKIIKLDNFVVE